MESRKLLYPYTLTAKVMQFPLKYYYQNSVIFKSWLVGVVILIPFMYKIQRLSFSDYCIQQREERLKRDEEEYKEHLKHRR